MATSLNDAELADIEASYKTLYPRAAQDVFSDREQVQEDVFTLLADLRQARAQRDAQSVAAVQIAEKLAACRAECDECKKDYAGLTQIADGFYANLVQRTAEVNKRDEENERLRALLRDAAPVIRATASGLALSHFGRTISVTVLLAKIYAALDAAQPEG